MDGRTDRQIGIVTLPHLDNFPPCGLNIGLCEFREGDCAIDTSSLGKKLLSYCPLSKSDRVWYPTYTHSHMSHVGPILNPGLPHVEQTLTPKLLPFCEGRAPGGPKCLQPLFLLLPVSALFCGD